MRGGSDSIASTTATPWSAANHGWTGAPSGTRSRSPDRSRATSSGSRPHGVIGTCPGPKSAARRWTCASGQPSAASSAARFATAYGVPGAEGSSASYGASRAGPHTTALLTST